MRKGGLFIVLEGSDGSGKTTQFNLLKERLKAVGYDVAVFDFPRYEQESSHFVRKYLNGHYGPASQVSPYTASLFYALDRFEAAKDINKALAHGKIVIANRYVGSNMAHQGAKFSDPVEQRGFFVWADNLEFQLLNLPRPDINLFLRVPANISYNLVAKKTARNYTKNLRDEHEQDKEHLKKSVATYDLLCQLFPKDFKAVECTKADRLLGVAEINNLIWERLKPMLPDNKPRSSHSVVVTLGLDEGAKKASYKDLSDDLEFAFTNCSLILWLHLQRAGYANLLPEFANWADSRYQYNSSPDLPSDVRRTYKAIMEQLAAAHARLHYMLIDNQQKHLVNNTPGQIPLTSALLLSITPVGALTNIKLRLKKNDIASLAASLLASDAAELQWAAKQLYLAARSRWPLDFENPLESKDSPVPLNHIIAKLAEERLPQNFSHSEPVNLVEVRPRLEFDLLAESIYPYSTLSLNEIAEEVSNWPYLQKRASLKEALAQPEILNKVRYKLDVLSDQMTLSQMLMTAGLVEVQVQAFTPRYGYDVPQLIEDIGAEDLYEECFEQSLKLYSLLQGSGHDETAAYAALLGHKIRWQLNASATQLKKILENENLKTSPIAVAISERAAEIHPLLWEIISNSSVMAATKPRNGKSRVKPYHRPTHNKTRKKLL